MRSSFSNRKSGRKIKIEINTPKKTEEVAIEAKDRSQKQLKDKRPDKASILVRRRHTKPTEVCCGANPRIYEGLTGIMSTPQARKLIDLKSPFFMSSHGTI